jgi:hypothetical protein
LQHISKRGEPTLGQKTKLSINLELTNGGN